MMDNDDDRARNQLKPRAPFNSSMAPSNFCRELKVKGILVSIPNTFKKLLKGSLEKAQFWALDDNDNYDNGDDGAGMTVMVVLGGVILAINM